MIPEPTQQSQRQAEVLDCTIIIPTRDQLNYLKPCIESILGTDTACSFEILVMDNDSQDKVTRSYLESLVIDPRIKVIHWTNPFNFSEINNAAAEMARGEVLCFLNNDTRVITPDWLDQLVPIAAQQGVGAIGALLLYPDRTIQHGGITLDHEWVAKHIAVGEDEDFFSGSSRNNLFSVDAVSAACMLTRRELFRRTGGFNQQSLAVSFNDVDYCLTLKASGYAVLMAPFVKLFHYESVSRKSDDLPENQPRAAAEKRYMLRKWHDKLQGQSYESGIPDKLRFLGEPLEGKTHVSEQESITSFLARISRQQNDQQSPKQSAINSDDSQDKGKFWEDRYQNLEIEFWALENRYRDIEATLNSIVLSRFWRVSAPVRWAFYQLKRIKQALGRGMMEFHWGRKFLALKNRQATAVAIEETATNHKANWSTRAEENLTKFLLSGEMLRLPESTNPEVSVILVFYNKAELSLLCLQSLVDHTECEYEVIIVDNASSDDTSRLLLQIENAVVISNSSNVGFVKAVNQAAEHVRGRAMLLLNNDAVLEKHAIDNALATLDLDLETAAVGGKITLLDNSLQEAGSIIWQDGSCLGYGRGKAPMDPEFMFRRPVDYCSGAFLLLDSTLFKQMQGLDEDYAPAYYEESDFCARLWEAGKSVIYEPTACLKHYEFASSGGFEGAEKLQAEHRGILCQKRRKFLASRPVPDERNILRARTHNNNKNVLFIDDCVPHPELGAGYPRSAEFVEALVESDLNLTFYPLRNSYDVWERTYSTLPTTVEVMLYLGREGLEDFLRDREGFYDYIIVSRVHNMEFLHGIIDRESNILGDARLIYDAEAVTAPREILRRQLLGENISSAKQSSMINNELDLAHNCHKVITVSRAESELYKQHGIENTTVLGHKLAASPTPATFSERKDMLFIGALREDNSPNVDSVLWFIKEVFPLLTKQLGEEFSLLVIGDNTAPGLRNLHSDQIKFLGRMNDVVRFYNHSRLFVAPTRFAAGIPRKVHETAAYGLPSVTTALLAEQLGWVHESQLMIADSPEEFAASCVRLYQDQKLWEKIRKNALIAIEKDCSPTAFSGQVKNIFS